MSRKLGGDTTGTNQFNPKNTVQKSQFEETKTNYNNNPIRPLNAEAIGAKTTEIFDPKSIPTNYFYVSVSGVIESGNVTQTLSFNS
jgi:hypothetical protein